MKRVPGIRITVVEGAVVLVEWMPVRSSGRLSSGRRSGQCPVEVLEASESQGEVRSQVSSTPSSPTAAVRRLDGSFHACYLILGEEVEMARSLFGGKLPIVLETESNEQVDLSTRHVDDLLKQVFGLVVVGQEGQLFDEL